MKNLKRFSIPLVMIVLTGQIALANPPCGIENCHGIDIPCGPHVPDGCTAMYGLGDFCRKFAHCEFLQGNCQLKPEPQFESCVACVRACQEKFPGDQTQDVWDCEAACREKFP